MKNITFRIENSSDGVVIFYKNITILAIVEWAPYYSITLHRWVSTDLKRIGIDFEEFGRDSGQCVKIKGVDNYEDPT